MTNLGSVETWHLLAWPVLLQSWWHECQMLYSAPVRQSYISPSVCQTTPWCSSHSSVVCTVCKCCRCFISREFVFVFWRVISCYYISSEAPSSLFLLPAYVWFIPPYRSHFTLISGLPALLWHTSEQHLLLQSDCTHSAGSCTLLRALSLLPSKQCNYQPRCVFAVRDSSLHHAGQAGVGEQSARERAWMGEPEQGRYIPELTNYCMWVIKKH